MSNPSDKPGGTAPGETNNPTQDACNNKGAESTEKQPKAARVLTEAVRRVVQRVYQQNLASLSNVMAELPAYERLLAVTHCHNQLRNHVKRGIQEIILYKEPRIANLPHDLSVLAKYLAARGADRDDTFPETKIKMLTDKTTKKSGTQLPNATMGKTTTTGMQPVNFATAASSGDAANNTTKETAAPMPPGSQTDQAPTRRYTTDNVYVQPAVPERGAREAQSLLGVHGSIVWDRDQGVTMSTIIDCIRDCAQTFHMDPRQANSYQIFFLSIFGTQPNMEIIVMVNNAMLAQRLMQFTGKQERNDHIVGALGAESYLRSTEAGREVAIGVVDMAIADFEAHEANVRTMAVRCSIAVSTSRLLAQLEHLYANDRGGVEYRSFAANVFNLREQYFRDAETYELTEMTRRYDVACLMVDVGVQLDGNQPISRQEFDLRVQGIMKNLHFGMLIHQLCSCFGDGVLAWVVAAGSAKGIKYRSLDAGQLHFILDRLVTVYPVLLNFFHGIDKLGMMRGIQSINLRLPFASNYDIEPFNWKKESIGEFLDSIRAAIRQVDDEIE